MTTKNFYREKIKSLQNRNHTLMIVVFLLLLLSIGQIIYTFKTLPNNLYSIQQELVSKNNTIQDLENKLANKEYEVKQKANDEE
ncbi:hypothetical protein [Lactobacillus sp. ESL0681]|uniref:hypothetical protein n=1 Tax=Lactobacillus sp. ESL0681 TaxID=2983211 RepID=UPI0023F75C77|nr:hypothetical protein [Lactobacillus sp. ESL0681]WEV41278.1 hypothetical protein OZX59_09430 [Lactobacillus sp. ESL0681]